MESAIPGIGGLIVLGDWGTSHLRLWLCAGDTVLDSRTGPGLAPLNAAGHRAADVFVAEIAPWRRAHGVLGALLCGMVGSNIGWADAGYVPCPAVPQDLADAAKNVIASDGSHSLIVPGLACGGLLGGPDVMRGEETQIVGSLALLPRLTTGRHLLCLPGTHSKWAIVEQGAIIAFQTALTGELFAVLQAHSILLARTAMPASEAGFDEGVARVRAAGPEHLLHMLFETRSRQLRLGMEPAHATGFLSGLLIGAEIAAMAKLASAESGSVTLVGASPLTALYARALAAFGFHTSAVDGALASRTGLQHLHNLRRDRS
ncbi:MAG: 2-dehydro-3-deoxygalactonokinase [Novosphingobium sp.]